MASTGGRHRVSTGLGGVCKIASSKKNTPKGGPSKYQNIKKKTDFLQLAILLDEHDPQVFKIAFEVDRKINQYLSGIDQADSPLTHTEASDEYGRLYNRRRKFLQYDG